jgi:hypothetical protein
MATVGYLLEPETGALVGHALVSDTESLGGDRGRWWVGHCWVCWLIADDSEHHGSDSRKVDATARNRTLN